MANTKGLLLLSGGFDSPVAGLLAQRQGIEVHALHFTAHPMFGMQSLPKAKALAEKIQAKTFTTIDIGPMLSQFARDANHKYYFVFMKRLFLRISETIANENKCEMIITGENLGQVSSQTLSNIAAIAPATKLSVMRPLLCLDKQEIIDLSKKFGTHDLSIGPEVCDALGPKKPATVCTVEKIEIEEKKIPLEKLLVDAFKTKKAGF
ncbi:MAG: 7-cyano-7-deazaguanine synthase [Candidatus Diapherotrites archaeon]|uniref:7-cyano-7-deazaguanine synthase n=1 Tax=Candidatus Iainarchaeum sp. TaxID=3101447 RepID=A0A8T4LGL5_9ARCH|nr:7-cyano-7-deazaguanine synthase [Candidatus Diapherotrites archaeon]